MIGLLLRAAAGPVLQMGGIVTLLTVCCMGAYCCKWGIRDCHCCKKILRCLIDPFSDFDLMVLVHEAQLRPGFTDDKTYVRLTAGRQTVDTDKGHKGQYQQPLQLHVEQGSPCVTAELMDQSGVIAKVEIDIMKSILSYPPPTPEQSFKMKVKRKGVHSANIILTMVPSYEGDEETGLVSDVNGEMNWLVKQQLKKAQDDLGAEDSEMNVLKTACSGPVELFNHLGKADQMHLSILGPPMSRKWALGLWSSKGAFDNKQPAAKEVDLMKVTSVEADPMRSSFFVIAYVDEHRAQHRLLFRRIERARDVWVDLLTILITKARDQRKAVKTRTRERMNPIK